MKRYAIWNKQDPVITPSGRVFTPEQWIERHPAAGVENAIVVCDASEVNGAFFATLGQMVRHYEVCGCDFSACETPEERLEAIEAFEDVQNAPAEGVSNEELTATSLASIAASLEYQNLMTLEDAEEV